MYRPPRQVNLPKGSSQGVMPTAGTNLRDFSALLNTTWASWIENYWIHGSGRLVKRKGTVEDFDTGESTPIPLRQQYVDGYEIVAYGQKVRALKDGVFTNIKTDFSASNAYFDGVRTGDYFFVTTLTDGLWRISRTITYSKAFDLSGSNTFLLTGGSGTLGIGDIITGTNSGETAVVVSVSGALPSTYTVVVNTLSGAFDLGEPITGGSLGASVALSNYNPFTVGKELTGGTSGAEAIILQDASGTITLGSINGDFQNGEILTDDNGTYARGTATSTVEFSIAQETAAPKAKYIIYGEGRLLLYNLKENPAGWAYSNRDLGTNPPFTNFTVGSGYNDPGEGYYRNGETCNSADMIGNIYFIALEKGWTAFSIDQTDLAGVSGKYDNILQESDLGIKKVKMTDVGLIACGTFGVKRLVSLGQPNIPYSEQWETLTEQLGEDYFTDVDFSDSDIVYDDMRGYIYISCAKGGATKNLILAIKADIAGVESDVKTSATSFFTGLNPYKFLKKDREFYFTSSIDGIAYHLFSGENDDGVPIYCEYLQELNISTTENFNLDMFKCEGELSPASSITVYFDVFDLNGRYQADRKNYTWEAQNDYSGGGGWGPSPWGSSAWGATGTQTGLIYSKARMQTTIRNITRVQVRFTSSDTADHILALFSATASIVTDTRNNTLTPNS